MTERPHTLHGCGTALVTPFRADGRIDEAAVQRLVQMQLDAGVQFLVPCGSTGEAATLSFDEHVRVVELVAQVTDGRVPIVAGAGSNDTAKAIAFSHAVHDAGATHLLHVSPMYNKPPQRGVLAHFGAIADACALPILLYNVPGRTAGNMEANTTLALAQHPQVIGIKEASGNFGQLDIILRERPHGFAVFSGDDALTLPMLALGGDGVVSVVSNLFPTAMVQLVHAASTGDFSRARQLHRALLPFFFAAFVESNPMPIKAAMAQEGWIENVLRMPLVPLADAQHDPVMGAVAEVRRALAALD